MTRERPLYRAPHAIEVHDGLTLRRHVGVLLDDLGGLKPNGPDTYRLDLDQWMVFQVLAALVYVPIGVAHNQMLRISNGNLSVTEEIRLAVDAAVRGCGAPPVTADPALPDSPQEAHLSPQPLPAGVRVMAHSESRGQDKVGVVGLLNDRSARDSVIGLTETPVLLADLRGMETVVPCLPRPTGLSHHMGFYGPQQTGL